MDFLKIMIAAFSATNVMTTFSYLLSATYDRLFKEPVLLNFVLDEVGFSVKSKWTGFSGWLAHYCIGLLFVLVYDAVWMYTDIEFGFISGIAFGIVSGVIGIAGWHLIFKLPNNKPNVQLRDYYIQLFFAHIIFACAVVVAFKIYDYDVLSRLT